MTDHKSRPGDLDISAAQNPLDFDFERVAAQYLIHQDHLTENDLVEEVSLDIRVAECWRWFECNEERIFNIELDEHNLVSKRHMDRILEIEQACGKVDSDVGLEIAANDSGDGRRTLVITAGGIERAVPFVQRMFELAPVMTRWRIVKFRQRELVCSKVALHGNVINPDDLLFCLDRHCDTGEFSVRVFMPDYEETAESIWEKVGFVILDSILGEIDVIYKIKGVTFFEIDSKTGVKKLSLHEFVKSFDPAFQKCRH